MNAFHSFDLNPALLKSIEEMGFKEPTEIQSSAIPELIAGNDVLGQAQTGTGKTAAFALPLLNHLNVNKKHVQGLILAPTRELAVQVAEATQQLGRHLDVNVLPVYGGQSYTTQLRGLKAGAQIVVGTPGRLLDLVNKKKALDLSRVDYLVLDEADEMLAMGFVEEVEEIIKLTPESRQTAFFSATLPSSIRKMAGQYLKQPQEIAIKAQNITVDQIEQRYYLVRSKDKVSALVRVFETEEVQSALLFTRTKARASEMSDALLAKDYSVEALHGDLKQSEREKVLDRYRKGLINILVATDVAARGLDIDGVSHVINVDVPLDAESYVHRIGRTGRAGKSGTAITFATPDEQRRLASIERYIKQSIPRAELPTVTDIQSHRDEVFTDRIVSHLALEEAADEVALVEQIIEFGYDPVEIAAAAIHIARESEKLRAIEKIKTPKGFATPKNNNNRAARRQTVKRKKRVRGERQEKGMIRLSINVGRVDNVHPGNIVGAIANTSGIPGSAIGAIDIQSKMTFLDVSEKYVDVVLKKMDRWKIQNKTADLQCV